MVLFLGLGRMGLPMATHAIAKGIRIQGYDPMTERVAALKAAGGDPVENLNAALAQAELIVVVVGQEKEVETLFRGPGGINSAGRPGAVVLVVSTVDPTLIAKLGAEAAARGVKVLDTPVCRGEMGAETGTLLALVAGEEESYLNSLPVLRTFCSDVFYLGAQLGKAQVAKTVNNLIAWSALVATYEASRISEAWDIDWNALRKFLEISSADNWSLRNWDRVSDMPWSKKDMSIALRIASSRGVEVPLCQEVERLVQTIPILRHG